MIQMSRKIQLYPTKKQITGFKQACGVARLAYNWALAEWQRQYREDKEYLSFCRHFGVSVYDDALHKPTANKLDIQFNQIKKVEFPFVYHVPSCIPQQAMKHLNTAFQRFFKGQSGFPQFKRKGRSKAIFHLTNTRFSIEGAFLTVSPFGQIKMSRLLDVEGKIVNGSICERGGKWFLSVTVQMEKPLKTFKPFGTSIGVDLGIKHLATLSNGEQFASPRPLKRYLKKIKQLHRELHRRQKGSHNRAKTKTKLSRLYYKITCIRQDVLHKLTTHLISEYGLIAIEDLNVQGMLKNHKLAQAIADVGFYEFKRQLVYKAQWHQRTILAVDRFFPSSKRCSCCGYVRQELPLSIRTWTCESCGESHDRDVNAAKNILNFAYWFNKIPVKSERLGRTLKTCGVFSYAEARRV